MSGLAPHDQPHQFHPPTRNAAIWVPIAVACVFVVLVIIGAWHRVHSRHEQEDFSHAMSQVGVEVVTVKRDSKPKELMLPGNIEAFQEAIIYPRSNGYVRSWKVDIGDNVKEGDVLAEIETPEVDQQVAQAKASYDLADATAARWRELAAKKVVAEQDRDEKETAKRTAQANLEQVQKTQGFNRILAPFAGKISARKIDVGALVSATTPLFSLEQNDPLRVYIYAPQANAPSIKEGLKATVDVQELPGQNFEGMVTRTAGALDPSSRSMQVEVQVPNHDGRLLAGMYGEVKFFLPETNAPLVIPSNAFVFRTEGPQVAVVTDQRRIHWQPVRIGRDFGTRMEVLDGLQENSNVVMNPTDDLQEGLEVQVKAPAKKPAPSPGERRS